MIWPGNSVGVFVQAAVHFDLHPGDPFVPEMGVRDKSPGKWSVDGDIPGSPELFPECCCKRPNPGSRTGGEAPRPLLSLVVSIIPQTDKGPLLACVPVGGRAVREHGMAVHRECYPVGIEEKIDSRVVREIMVHEKAVNYPDIREVSVAIYRRTVNRPQFDHTVRIAGREMVRGPVQVHHHPRDIGIEVRDDPVMELVERPGCRVAVISRAQPA